MKFDKYKPLLITASICVVVIIIYAYIQKRKVVKDKFDYLNAPVPTDFITYDANGEATTVNLSDEDAAKVSDIVIRLYEDMVGMQIIFLDQRDTEVYEELSSSSDTIFVAVNNHFNNQFINEGHGTLRNWLSDEYFSINDWSISSTIYSVVNNSIIPRMGRLNLK